MTHALLNLNQSLKPELKPVGLDQLLKGTERILRRVLQPLPESSASIRWYR
jgi:hypothetical protein